MVHWSEIIWDGYQTAGIGIDKAPVRDAYVYAERELARTPHTAPHNFLDLLRKMQVNSEGSNEIRPRGDPMQADTDGHLSGPLARYCYNAAREVCRGGTPCARSPLFTLSHGAREQLLRQRRGRSHRLRPAPLLPGHHRGSAVVGVRKPDPAIFALGVDALGMKPGEGARGGRLSAQRYPPGRELSDAGWHGSKGKGWTPEGGSPLSPPVIKKLSDLLDVAF